MAARVTGSVGRARPAMLVLASAVLAACGGGGGNTRAVSPPPAAPPPGPPVVYAANPDYSRHLTNTNAAPAAAAGLTGEGVVIGVVDTGVMRSHPALYPRVTETLIYVDPNRNNTSIDDVDGHGTAIAQTIAGTAFGSWPGGVAPGATIISARIINDEPPEDDGSGQGNEVDGALGLAPIHQDLIDRGVRIMNNSWGGLYWTNPNATSPIAGEYRPFIINNGGLVVFATGNAGFDDPSNMAALPSQLGPNGTTPAADLERGWIAVTALDDNDPNLIASYANRCGEAMHYCMAAPGTVVVTGTNDTSNSPSYWQYSGTSLAAPLVSGAAALVWEAFPYFNNDLVRQTLLGTADDLGAAGVDPIYGYGRLNIGNAIRGPGAFDWGTVSVDFSGESTWSNNIRGSGGLTKDGDGKLLLSGRNTYTGATTVNGGSLEATYQLRGAATAGADATLTLGQGVDGTLVNNGSVRLVGAARNTVIGGNYQQSASARLLFMVGAPLHVRGTAALNGELQVTGIATGYTRQDRETVVQADGGLSGTFSSLSSGPGVFLEATLGYDTDTAWLDITRLDVSATAQAMGMSSMAVSSGTRVEGAFDVIDGVKPGEGPGGIFIEGAGALQRSANAVVAERTLESLSGAVQTADSLMATMAIEGGRRSVESRIDAGNARFNAGGAWADRNGFQRQAASRLAVDSHGWTMGQDFNLGRGITAGAAFGQTEALAWFGGTNDRDRARMTDGQVYGAWEHGNNYVFGRYAYGRIDRDVQRQMLLGDGRFDASSTQNSRYRAFELQAGRHFDVAGNRLTPYTGVQAMQLDRDGFSEQEIIGFGLQADASRMRATQAIAGLRFDREWSAGGVQFGLDGRAEWVRTLSQSGNDINARFNAVDVWSPILGQPFDDQATIFGVGFNALFPRLGQWRFGVDQRREFGQNWQQAQLDWNIAF